MAGTADRTQETPVRRMAVARGRLAGAVGLDDATRAHAAASGTLAVKDAARILPFLDAFLPTHVDVHLDGGEGGVSCTVTVQAYARAPLDAAALLGVAAALVAVAGEDARIEDVEIVQSVKD